MTGFREPCTTSEGEIFVTPFDVEFVVVSCKLKRVWVAMLGKERLNAPCVLIYMAHPA